MYAGGGAGSWVGVRRPLREGTPRPGGGGGWPRGTGGRREEGVTFGRAGGIRAESGGCTTRGRSVRFWDESCRGAGRPRELCFETGDAMSMKGIVTSVSRRSVRLVSRTGVWMVTAFAADRWRSVLTAFTMRRRSPIDAMPISFSVAWSSSRRTSPRMSLSLNVAACPPHLMSVSQRAT